MYVGTSSNYVKKRKFTLCALNIMITKKYIFIYPFEC